MTSRSATPVTLSKTSATKPPWKRNGRGAELIAVDSLAEWLGVEVVFVRRLVAERRIPFVRIGRYVRFDPDEVAQWIDERRVSSNQGRSVSRGARSR